MKRLKFHVPNKILKSVYYAYVAPHLDYGIINWGCVSTVNLNPIRKCVNKAFDILGKANITHMLSFDEFHTFQINKFM